MSILRSAMRALDVGNAVAWAAKGLKEKQFYDVFAAYARGAVLPRAGGQTTIGSLAGLEGNWARGAARLGIMSFGAIATWNMLPRNNALAVPMGIGAAAGTYYGLGRVPYIAQGGGMATGLRAAGGLIAGSLIYQGLRAASPSEYQVTG